MPTPTVYTYSIASDFPGGKANAGNLQAAIQQSSIVTALSGINTDGDVLSIFFKDALSVSDKTTLDGNTTGPAGGLIASTSTGSTTSPLTATNIALQANISNDGALNGTSTVTIVSSPSSGVVRAIRTINISNGDTAPVILTVQLLNIAATRIIWKGTLQPGDTWQYGDGGDTLVLDSPSKSIIAFMSAPPTTKNPDFTCCYGDTN